MYLDIIDHYVDDDVYERASFEQECDYVIDLSRLHHQEDAAKQWYVYYRSEGFVPSVALDYALKEVNL